MAKSTSSFSAFFEMVSEPWRQIKLASTAPTDGWYTIDETIDLWIKPNNALDRQLVMRKRGLHIGELVQKWVRPGDAAIDVGSGSGFVALHLARRVGSTGIVFSFEPDERVIPVFNSNVQRNDCRNIALQQVALGRSNENMRFYLSSQRGWSTFFPVSATRMTIDDMKEIAVVTFDTLRSAKKIEIDPGRLSFINLDCAGAEPFVLEGMEELLRDSDPLINVSVSEEHLRTAGSSLEELQHVLASAGFVFLKPVSSNLFGPTVTFRKQMNIDADGTHDIVAIRLQRMPELAARGIQIRA